MDIETEIRSFITEEQYNHLLEFFGKEAALEKEDYQETFYFDCEQDLRIQRNKFFSKIWMKKGKIHDDHREEIEIKFEREEFDRLERLFLALGYNIEIKWFRKRHQFIWEDVTVCIDYTRGYGHIIELEKMCTEETKKNALELLKKKLESLGVKKTPKEEFHKAFENYKKNWKELTSNQSLQKPNLN